MRLLTSLLNAVNKLIAVYCLVAALVLLWPLSGFIALFALAVHVAKKRRKRRTTLGSAAWAEEEELRSAGLLGASSGLIIGRLLQSDSLLERLGAKSRRRDEIVRLPRAIHSAIFAPTGVGKGVSIAIPFLFTSPESAVVLDFKGELALQTAEFRRRVFGHEIALLDVYKTITQTPSTFNPLSFIHKDSSLAIDDCNDLANSLVVRTGNEHEPHFNDVAEMLLAAIIATVVAYGDLGGTRSLHTVREIISQPRLLDLAVKLMLESDLWGGALRPMGGQIMSLADKEKASVLSTAHRHLRFLGTPAVAESTRTSSFDPSLLRKGRLTCYLILPPDRANAQSGLLRMWVGSLMRACVRGGLQ